VNEELQKTGRTIPASELTCDTCGQVLPDILYEIVYKREDKHENKTVCSTCFSLLTERQRDK